jgi:hypothetical protein
VTRSFPYVSVSVEEMSILLEGSCSRKPATDSSSKADPAGEVGIEWSGQWHFAKDKLTGMKFKYTVGAHNYFSIMFVFLSGFPQRISNIVPVDLVRYTSFETEQSLESTSVGGWST